VSDEIDRLRAAATRALEQLDRGELEEARRTLLALVPAAPAARGLEEAVGDDEIDDALAAAEPEREEMLDANRIAEQAMVAAMGEAFTDGGEGFGPVAHPSFATETMAALLERQGDREGAQAVRAAIRGGRTPQPLPEVAAADAAREQAEASTGGRERSRARRRHQIATLERWLRNLGRGLA
jgi:hypothetical protein